MNAEPNRRKSWTSLLSFIFAILFVLHVMVIPAWLGLRAIMIFETDNGFFSVIPAWFVGSGLLCLTLALVLGFLPEHTADKNH